MPLTSASTFAEVKAAYLDNAAWEGNVAKATAFVQACRFLLLLLPSQTGRASAMTQFRPELIKDEMERASAYVACAGSVANNVHPNFTNFRD